MARNEADGSGPARVAVVGAATAAGALVRDALAAYGVPGARVDLFGTAAGEAVLSEYAGEARLIQPADRDEVGRHRIVFLCEVSKPAAAIAALAGPGRLVLDMTGAYGGPDGGPLVGSSAGPDREGDGGLLQVAHPLSIVLADLLGPVDRAFGLCGATAVVLRPAADFGEAGIEELREQTLRLLRFERTPRDVFGGQLAFNAIPQARLPGDEPGLERRIAVEVASLLGWPEERLALRCVAIPVFHGHAISLRLDLASASTVDGVRSVFGANCGVRLAGAGSKWTPLGAPEDRRTDVCEISEDGLGGYWIWAIAGAAGRASAERAVSAAAAVLDMGATEGKR